MCSWRWWTAGGCSGSKRAKGAIWVNRYLGKPPKAATVEEEARDDQEERDLQDKLRKRGVAQHGGAAVAGAALLQDVVQLAIVKRDGGDCERG